MKLDSKKIVGLLCLFMVSVLGWIFGLPYLTSQEKSLLDLSGEWQVCSPVNDSVNYPCTDSVTSNVPVDSPKVAHSPGFSGWLKYEKTFKAPLECTTGSMVCSILIGEIGDTVEMRLNGVVLGRNGEFPPLAMYAKHYGVKFDLPPQILKTQGLENQLSLIIYSLKRSQSGITQGPIGIFSARDAFRIERSINVRTIIFPMFSSIVFLIIAIITLILVEYHKIQDDLSVRYLFYCLTSSIFLFSISETIREYISIDLAGYAHFFSRTAFDFSHFALVSTLFFPSNPILKKMRWLYGIPLSLFIVFPTIHAMGFNISSTKNGFDIAHFIMRMSAPLVFLPVAIGLYGAWITQKTNGKNLLIVYAALTAAQLFDILVFHGVIRGFYFCKLYPMPLGIFFGYLIIRRYQIEHEERVRQTDLDNQTNQAVARMTQSLAHDVRKPFSMLKTGLNLLQVSSANPQKFSKNLGFLVSEIERATKSVDGMLTDVMEIGSTSTELILEPVSPESLIESTLGEIFRVYPKSKISISYDLQHTAMVNVHLKKVNRVFSNIVGNAVQAVNFSGSLWIKTKMVGHEVQFCIGNAGSLIPPESLNKLFEAFFTSGKKGGTGLGLAIAQKVVQAHNGKIWCESSKTEEHPQGKVEFYFTLPIALGTKLVTTATLPKHSDEITQIIAMMGGDASRGSQSEFNKNEELLLQEVVARAKALSIPVEILIVDDETIYRSALAGWIEEAPELNQLCKIHHAHGSHETFKVTKNNKIDLIITDIDMGPKSLTGFELVKDLRNTHQFKGLIFVHSNRIVPDDHRRAGDLGADGFLPKPMAKGQLFKLLLQTIQGLLPAEATAVAREEVPGGIIEGFTSPNVNADQINDNLKPPLNLVAIIDDEDIFRDQWPAFLGGFDAASFSTAEDFLRDWDKISGRLCAVLTDKYLGAGMDGVTLGGMLRSKSPNLVIILSTSDMGVKDPSSTFNLIVDKDAFEEAPKIIQYLKSNKA